MELNLSSNNSNNSGEGICTWCKSRALPLVPRFWRESYVEDRRPFGNVDRAGQDGCLICALLSAGVVASAGKEHDGGCTILTTFVPSLDKSVFTLEFRYYITKGTRSPRFDFCSPAAPRFVEKGQKLATVDHGYQVDTLNSLVYLPTAIPDSRDDQCIEVIKAWISACSSSHSTCSPGYQRTAPLPRRVIDVGSEGTNEAPRLLETNGELDYYISLSHCWGAGQHFVTESANLRERCNIITRKLGIRYLWIDSLCILQDDGADWDIELTKMGDIYKNSYITIAAVSASDDQTGFLGPRTTGRRLDVSGLSYLLPNLQIREISEATEEEPLDTRAWAFQERLLSQKILSFCKDEMRWDCNCAYWSESGCAQAQVRRVRRQDFYESALGGKGFSSASGSQVRVDDRSVYWWWYTSVIPAYAKLRLTKEEDRLPALSAIADVVLLKTHDTYLAGLWKCDMICGLLWRSTSGRYWPEPGRLPTGYCGPTWSWASIQPDSITTELNIIQNKYNAKVLDARCELAGISPTAAVRSGFVRLKCFWVPVTLKITAMSSMNSEQSMNYSFDGLPTHNNGHLEQFWPDVPLISGPGATETTIQRSNISPGSKRPAFSAPVSCILIAQSSAER